MGFGAFFSAVSGVQGHLFSMSIVGNNIANANTIGFKSGQVSFREALVQTMRGASPAQNGGGINPMQVGLGMEVASVHSDLAQGMLQETGNVTDLAVQGDGFFIVRDGDRELYTRAGNFSFDAEGRLVSRGSGLVVQGWLADDTGRIPTGSPVEDIQLPFGVSLPGRATTEVSFNANLDATATTSEASLDVGGTTGIQIVQGKAVNGAGGVHEITISGVNATPSSALGTNANGAPLSGSETLSSLGVTDPNFDLEISVDNGARTVMVKGLGATSTVNDVITRINALGIGVTASLDAGEVRLTRDYAGDGTNYNVSVDNVTAGSIGERLFGAAPGSSFVVNNGTASTITAQDVFTPTDHAPLATQDLTVKLHPDTGLAYAIDGVGGGGVIIEGDQNSGLAAGTARVNTAATTHLTSLNVFDSLGNAHTLNVSFSRSGTANQWFWEASFNDGETISSGGSGSVTFNNDGSIRSWLFDNGGDTLTVNPGSDADPITMRLVTGTPGAFDGLTQFASPFTAKANNQDGYTMGVLDSISIDKSGLITGFFSNGVLRSMGQVVLAEFNNPDGLLRVGGNIYQMSSNSGTPIVGAAGTTIPGEINSGALEMSNVDLSEEFVQMIVSQRGFQANARVITTGDEMMTDMINLKR